MKFAYVVLALMAMFSTASEEDCIWVQKDGYYVEEGNALSDECYDTLEEAQNLCISADDCGAVATQNNECEVKYSVTHGGPTFIYYENWLPYDLRSWELVCGVTADSEVCVVVGFQPGSYDDEVSWKVLADESTVCEVTQGAAGSGGVSECCALAGTEANIECNDSYGDGWNDYKVTFDGVEICSGFIDGHALGDTFSFPGATPTEEETAETGGDFTVEAIGSYFCFTDQDYFLLDLGQITVQECIEACSQNAVCVAIQMDCGKECWLLRRCSDPKPSGCGSESYFVHKQGKDCDEIREQCCAYNSQYGMIPGVTWGSTPPSATFWHSTNNCDTVMGGSSLTNCPYVCHRR